MKFYKYLLMTGVVFITIGIHNSARPQSIETLVMPGPVSEAHAGIETECSECHAPFSKTLQRDLCLSCHEHKSVMSDLSQGTGFHGRSKTARSAECASCHTDHQGRDADILGFDVDTFRHDSTDFQLDGAHTSLACVSCHEPESIFREAPSDCVNCHREVDAHQANLGENCGECHQTTAWQTTGFDHAIDTEFLLTGAHQSTDCALCHANQRYQGIATDCHSCHQLDDQHHGQYGESCDQCHQTSDWNQTDFDHEEASGFALEGQHGELKCASCHQDSLASDQLAQECVTCHLADNVHLDSNSTDCGACHDSQNWSGASFDHQADTQFPLHGAHADLECKACHAGGGRDLSVASDCISCHRVSDVHQQSLGENCGRCHQESGWSVNVLFDHDLTGFPLIGFHAVAVCEACHLSPNFADTPGACVECHQDDDFHQGSLGAECAACHNPNDWRLWSFDHNVESGFELVGAHVELECSGCHQSGDEYIASPPLACVACHRSDDVHQGQFGRQCARCHDSNSFGETEMLQ